MYAPELLRELYAHMEWADARILVNGRVSSGPWEGGKSVVETRMAVGPALVLPVATMTLADLAVVEIAGARHASSVRPAAEPLVEFLDKHRGR